MINDEQDDDKKLQAIYYAVADSIAEMPDEEVIAELREDGEEPNEVAGRVRNVFRRAFKDFHQQPLRLAHEEYERSLDAIQASRAELPLSVKEQRTLLAHIFAHNPEMGTAVLTAQHRQFKNLSDADVASLLAQLKALGALNDCLAQEAKKDE